MLGYPKLADIVVRMLAVAFLVGITYNPSGHCYWHWVTTSGFSQPMLKIFSGLLLGAGFLFCIRALIRSLNVAGTIPLALIIVSMIWLLSHWHVIDLADAVQRSLVIEAAIVLLLGSGVCFSIVRYHLTGQLDSQSLN
jgi:hypothetical protein